MATSTPVSDSQLFEDHFTVISVDPGKYDRAARVHATSVDGLTTMSLDVNSELFPCREGEALHVVLSSTLSMDGKKDDERKGWRDASKPGPSGRIESSLADMFDYVCYGKLYKFEDGGDGQTIKAYTSFGGLLMALEGPFKKLTPLRVEHIYLLAKK